MRCVIDYWAGRGVTLHLSASGREALAGVLDGEYVEVMVKWADELGLWILYEARDETKTTVALVKWNHFETAIMDVILEEPLQPKVIGFGKWQSGNRS